ncbi:MAG: PKD domain-containing protein [Cyclobacteriaceae bacterium]|nr:PKD domain-containing protein [Cyclobacteriaceae bacterium]MCK5469064.1 PKD domain-containing protein [Cyclobacteriaceae bacterium]
MKKLYVSKSILFLLFVVLIFSCNETDPLPISKADFRIGSISPEVDVPVRFDNLSLNASSYKWDFGDGTFDSLTISPEHTYSDPGSYSVKLTAYTEDGQTSEAIDDVDIGQRYLTGMFLININMKDTDGNPWDEDGSGPDVLYQLGPDDATSLDDLVFVFIDSLNVGQFSTPIGISTDDLIPDDYPLLNKDYFILLEEIDTVNNVPEFRLMANVVFNPIIPEDFINVTKNDDSTGDITIPFIVIEEFQFYLQFEIR